MKKFALCNQKGGVGKTTTAVNIACALGAAGKKTLLIDLDPQGNATSGVGIDKNTLESTVYELLINKKTALEVIIPTGFTKLDIIPSNAHLVGAEVELAGTIGREVVLTEALKPIEHLYDFILIDCPPSLGLLTINALVLSDALFVPLQCEYYALEGLGQLMATYRLVRERLNSKLEIGGVLLTINYSWDCPKKITRRGQSQHPDVRSPWSQFKTKF